jgi:hypothetical protein
MIPPRTGPGLNNLEEWIAKLFTNKSQTSSLIAFSATIIAEDLPAGHVNNGFDIVFLYNWRNFS